MLPATERLRKKGLFQRVYTTRKMVSTGLITLHFMPKLPGSMLRPPLAGFVVGKKVHNKACRRNLAKRRVREAYRLLRKELTLNGDTTGMKLEQWYAIVFVVHAKILEATVEEIEKSVRFCLRKGNEKFGAKPSKQQNV